jgi:MFS family permease
MITVSALLFFSTVNTSTNNTGLIMRMIVLGLGLGSTMPIFTLAVQSAVGRERLGEVTAGTQLFRSVGGTVGTAVLGGIMNSQLETQMEKLRGEPFVEQMHQLMPEKAAVNVNGSFIQTVLNPGAQGHIREGLNKIPPPYHDSVAGNFNHFIGSAKTAFSNSVDAVFVVAAILMGLALVAVFFLPEIPLRKSEKPAVQQAAVLLEDELAQSDEENQPGLQEQKP